MSGTAHLVVSLVTLGSFVVIVRLVRRRELKPKYALLWLTVGTVMVLLAISPALLDRVSLWLGISYGPATLFFAAITLLLLVAVHVSWELSRLEERTRTLAEELALLRAETSRDRPPTTDAS
ncbi:MAG TPA: DUF2304 domain-containing protein [Nitriliruptorales bacterium]|nr:DUF2304 domain-containing protein [Nitriliruptorales bacterium]